MAIKTWKFEAEFIEYGQVQIWLEDNVLFLQRNYTFKDAEGKEIELGFMNNNDNSILLSMPWMEVPENIRQALTELDIYSIDMIKQKEGIV